MSRCRKLESGRVWVFFRVRKMEIVWILLDRRRWSRWTFFSWYLVVSVHRRQPGVADSDNGCVYRRVDRLRPATATSAGAEHGNDDQQNDERSGRNADHNNQADAVARTFSNTNNKSHFNRLMFAAKRKTPIKPIHTSTMCYIQKLPNPCSAL